MKTYAPIAPRRARHIRVPAFLPVPLRARADGWTALRQAAFLGALAETGSVREAARRVGMARETAYRLRRRPGARSFAAAWDAVLGRASAREAAAARRKVTPEELARAALDGLLKPVIFGGRHVATERKADNHALLRLLARIDRTARGTGAGGSSSSGAARGAGERSQGLAARPASTRRDTEAAPGRPAQAQPEQAQPAGARPEQAERQG